MYAYLYFIDKINKIDIITQNEYDISDQHIQPPLHAIFGETRSVIMGPLKFNSTSDPNIIVTIPHLTPQR